MSRHGLPAAGVGPGVPSQAAAGVTQVRPGASAAGPPQLTARELEVLRLLGDARSTAQIASALAVSTNTVRGHVRTLLRKLAVAGRDDAVRCARELGLLPRRHAGAAGASLRPPLRWPTGDRVEAAPVTGEGKDAGRRVTRRVAAMRSEEAVRAAGAVRVLVLDEQEVVRRGVRQVLAYDPAITVVAEAASVAEAVARGLAVRPDVAVVGMRLPDGSGVEAWTRLRAGVPGLRCLVLSAYCDPATVQAAVSLGVAGYLLKDVRGPALVAAVHRVAAGGTVFPPEVLAAVSAATNGRPDPLDRLAPREREALRLLGDGLSNRQIGERLGLAEKTVKNYISNLLGKLGLQRRTQAAVLATELRGRLTAAPAARVAGGATGGWFPGSGGQQ